MHNQGARHGRFRVILGALVACVLVVLAPVEAWGATVGTWPGTYTADPTYSLSENAYWSGTGQLTVILNSHGNVAPQTIALIGGCPDGTFGETGVWDTFTGAAVAAGVTRVENFGGTNWCSGHGAASAPGVDRFLLRECTPTGSCGNTGTGAVVTTDAAFGTGAPSTCTTLTSASVSYVAGVLGVDLRATGTPPPGGWKVYVPGSSGVVGTGTPQGVVGVTTSIPGDFFSNTTVTLTVTGTTVWRVQSATDGGCYVSGLVNVTTAVVQGNPSNGTDTAGADCGLNPFCYVTAALRWAFVPTSAGATFSAMQTTMSGKPPYSVVVWGVNLVTSGTSDLGAVPTGLDVGSPALGIPSTTPFGGTYGCEAGSRQTVDCGSTPMVESAFPGAAAIKWTLRVMLWGAFIIALWKRLSGYLT